MQIIEEEGCWKRIMIIMIKDDCNVFNISIKTGRDLLFIIVVFVWEWKRTMQVETIAF